MLAIGCPSSLTHLDSTGAEYFQQSMIEPLGLAFYGEAYFDVALATEICIERILVQYTHTIHH